MCSGEADGVRWLYAFTSTTELERFARARVEAGTDPGWASGRIRYWTVLGSRLLKRAVSVGKYTLDRVCRAIV
ncbi:hypothetical protein [Streptomyces canus]|uniref:hypothetical protein n=1 Tax=Streptomyces canus TaxID=58343 RepID=UPI0033BA3E78